MIPLIDGDVLRYEIGFSGEYKDSDGEPILREFDFVADLLDDKIFQICEDVDASLDPIIFLTEDRASVTRAKRRADARRRWDPEYEFNPEYRENFRIARAKTKPYKGNRKENKPFHYHNLTEYMYSKYSVLTASGIEADDMMGTFATNYMNFMDNDGSPFIICSRDKDLRMIPGWHYSWECGKQASIGPIKVSQLGRLGEKNGKFLGTGLAFFYYQMLVGDAVDNIPGCPKVGPVKAKALLQDAKSEQEMFDIVYEQYKNAVPEDTDEYFQEQADLLWIMQDGRRKYNFPERGGDD